MSGHVSQHNDRSMAGQVRRHTGINVARCYQCGKCSAGCPMAEEMPVKPHDLLRLIQMDSRKALENDAIWLCLTCETCTARCPNQVDPARVIDSLREQVLAENPKAAPLRIRAFHNAFLKQIRRSGRVFEFGLVAGFKMRSGLLFNDVGAVPGMIRRGKLTFAPRRIKGLDDIRRIFKECQVQLNEADDSGDEPAVREVIS